MPERFTLVPRGAFSLERAAAFGFGPTEARALDGRLRLAFCVDGFDELAGVLLTQDEAGVHGEVHGASDVEVVRRQVARILSLDHDGEAWRAVGERDSVLGRLQAEDPDLRPVLFHSPYEAAAWAVISARRPARQMAEVRRRLGEEHGEAFELAGERLVAFPRPERLRALESFPGLNEQKVSRLRAVADAALQGQLDPERLLAMDPDQAVTDVRRLPGLGPFYAALVIVRATGFTDALPVEEPKVLASAAHFYDLGAPPDREAFLALAEPWRPFRTWAVVLLRVAGDRAGVTALSGPRG